MNHGYTYQSALAASEAVRWRIDDIIGGNKTLDFTKPFMPESLARVEQLTFLTANEQVVLNQIRGNAYLCIFGLVEEFILPFVMDHARANLRPDDYTARSLLQFASEEAKHIQLFKRFRAEFEKGFGTSCAVIGPPEEIAAAVLAHDPLAISLLILHIEWMVHRHYVESVKNDQELDTQFKSLLKHHWLDEVQHTKIDTLMVEALAKGRRPKQIDSAVEEYIELGGLLDTGLAQQVEFDMESFVAATGRKLSEAEKEKFREVQKQANRWTYIGSGMTHDHVLRTLESLSSNARKRIEEISQSFC